MDELTLTALCDAAGVSPRTVRYYITRGLLPPALSQGPAASYSPDHLHRLRLVKALQEQHLPLAEIRKRVEGLAEGEAEVLLREAEPPRPASSAHDYITQVLGQSATHSHKSPPRAPLVVGPAQVALPLAASPGVAVAPVSTWERHPVHPDVEVHVRRPLDTPTQRRLERLLDFARQLFKEPA